jgi:S-adenosylmethionine:tRNA ribosyltransferase-isomerase
MKVSDFDYDLPPELIAQQPLPRRDAARLMVIDRRAGTIAHRRFAEFPDLMAAGDLLVLNDTRVIPAKAWGARGSARIEFLFLEEREPGVWEVLCRPARRVRQNDVIVFDKGFTGVVLEAGNEGRRALRFESPGVVARLKEIGYAPLPPYIKRPKEDRERRAGDLERYQTVLARRDGAIAAPTAGLHFTTETFEVLRARGVDVEAVTLDVGPATFQPVRVEIVEEHRMLGERYSIASDVASAITAAKRAGRPVTAVGTTVVRTLESAWADGRLKPGDGVSSLFIYPGYAYRVVDRLLTNFHLPKSTLLMLVAAFAGHDLIMTAYRKAVAERYRFFSYGDGMLVV